MTHSAHPENKKNRKPLSSNGTAHAERSVKPLRPESQDVDYEEQFPLRSYLSDNGSSQDTPKLSHEILQGMMRHMVFSRELDDRLTMLQRQGRIGFYVGGTGEEAAMVGSAAALRPGDWVVPCYREAIVALYRGLPLRDIVANVFGRADDVVKGRQMPCHIVDRAHNYLSVSSPVGTQISQAMGIGWAAKLRKTTDVAVTYFGDGATSQGDFHYGLNFAGVHRIPVLFLLRNNRWAISTPLDQQTNSQTLAQKCIAYGIRGERVDGNDAVAVYQATLDAADRARKGEGATLLELCTYRQGAHSTSDDPRAYRDDAEVKAWLAQDPIVRLRAYLTGLGIWSQEAEAACLAEFRAELAQTISASEAAPLPEIGTLFSDVFRDKPWHLVEQEQEALSNLLLED
jgi:pyruvate dehydrogenase E1 component alpha subunit